MPVELLILILYIISIISFVCILATIMPENKLSVPTQIFYTLLSISVPLSIILWIKLTPFPKPTERIYTIEPNPIANTYISVVDGCYININRVTGEQVDPTKHNLKVTNQSGYSGGLYWTFKPTYSLVNKNLEK